MIDAESRSALAKRVQVAQIITFALITGVIAFGAIAVMRPGMTAADKPDALPLRIENLFALVLGGGAIVAAFALSAAFAEFGRRRIARSSSTVNRTKSRRAAPTESGMSDVENLAGLFTVRLIVLLAVLEGGALINLVVQLRQPEVYNLAAAGVLLVAMLTQIPTLDRAQRWIETQLRKLDEDRRFYPAKS